MDDALKSIMVCQPLQLYDCCPFSDGGSAVVLASEEKAKKLTNKPVYVVGVGQASAGNLLSQKEYLPRLRSRELAAKQSYDMAGVSPKDIDVVELHDCFSIAAIIALEGLGFFEFGKAGEAVEKGETKIGGKVASKSFWWAKSKRTSHRCYRYRSSIRDSQAVKRRMR